MASGRYPRSVSALLLVALSACSAGTLTLRETHYYAPSNDKNTNYYRLRVYAKTKLGASQYRSGWFPASSVDRLFGTVDDEGGVKALETRSAIEAKVAEKVKETYSAWLDSAAKPNADTVKLAQLQEAQRRVLAYPAIGATQPFRNALEVDYNPAKGVAIRRWDEKLVFILSSNPDDVVGKIANFSESDQTTRTINRFGQLLQERAHGELAAREAGNELRGAADTLVILRINAAVAAVAAARKDPKGETLAPVSREIQSLLALLEGSEP